MCLCLGGLTNIPSINCRVEWWPSAEIILKSSMQLSLNSLETLTLRLHYLHPWSTYRPSKVYVYVFPRIKLQVLNIGSSVLLAHYTLDLVLWRTNTAYWDLRWLFGYPESQSGYFHPIFPVNDRNHYGQRNGRSSVCYPTVHHIREIINPDIIQSDIFGFVPNKQYTPQFFNAVVNETLVSLSHALPLPYNTDI